MRCPDPGRGKKRDEYDFSKLTKFRSSGKRDENNLRKRPLCQVDFVHYFMHEAPSSLRVWSHGSQTLVVVLLVTIVYCILYL